MHTKLSYGLLIGILLLISTQCQSQVTKSKTLQDLVIRLNKDKSIQTQQRFFDVFPSTFKEFQSIYGYDDAKGAAPRYDDSKEHIDLFFRTSKAVDSIRFVTKLINICSDGKWEADAENYLQEGLRQYFFSHPNLIVSILSKFKANSIDHFWAFFVDGPVFDQDNFQKAKMRLTTYPVMNISLAKAAKVANAKSEKN